jgi:hypothetical protein
VTSITARAAKGAARELALAPSPSLPRNANDDVAGNGMIFSNDRTTNDALLNTLGDALAAAWVRFYAIEVDSRPGEVEYDRALGHRQEAGGRGRRDRRSR